MTGVGLRTRWAEEVFFGARRNRERRKTVLLKTKELHSLPPLPWSPEKCRNTEAWCAVKERHTV